MRELLTMWDTTNNRGAGAYHVRRKAEKFRQGLQNSRAFHHGKIKSSQNVIGWEQGKDSCFCSSYCIRYPRQDNKERKRRSKCMGNKRIQVLLFTEDKLFPKEIPKNAREQWTTENYKQKYHLQLHQKLSTQESSITAKDYEWKTLKQT